MSASRREMLSGAMSVAALTGLPFGFTAASETVPGVSQWQLGPVPPITAQGYGTDPDLIHPSTPWPNTLSPVHIRQLTRLCDVLLPADADSPSASEVGVPALIDAWVSAPYPRQQRDRRLLLAGLAWCDAEAQRRFAESLLNVSEAQLETLVQWLSDAESDPTDAGHSGPVLFFTGLRGLAVSIYYASPEGSQLLGYIGNVPIAGAYPGPSPAALQHLQGVLDELDLQMPEELNTDKARTGETPNGQN